MSKEKCVMKKSGKSDFDRSKGLRSKSQRTDNVVNLFRGKRGSGRHIEIDVLAPSN